MSCGPEKVFEVLAEVVSLADSQALDGPELAGVQRAYVSCLVLADSRAEAERKLRTCLTGRRLDLVGTKDWRGVDAEKWQYRSDGEGRGGLPGPDDIRSTEEAIQALHESPVLLGALFVGRDDVEGGAPPRP
jgi:hypothetical protein